MLTLTLLKSPTVNPLTGTTYRVTRAGPVIFGRSSDVAIRIVHPYVSRQHFQLIPLNQTWHLEHLSTKNPTIVNGEIVEDKVELKYGDKIRLGQFFFDVSQISPIESLVVVTEPVIDDALSRSEDEAPRDEDGEGTMIMEFEGLDLDALD
jgi:pSer/pThr/pTyr-binding forkhead associated (FHA) protein